ncbi:MAG: pirin family protein [Kofleriaceae bacterium]
MPAGTTPWPTPDPFLFCVHHDDRYPAGNDVLGPAAPLDGRRIGMDFAGKDGWRMYHGEQVPGFPAHPHRGFETVTVVRRGLLDHSDSLGAAARYGGGDVQWLTAGGGISHAEMFPLLDRDRPNPVELFQIWLNLPRVDKMVEPHFSMLWAGAIPRHVARDDAGRTTEITAIAGELAGARPPAPPPRSWASRPDTDVAIWTIQMAPGARWTLPAAQPGTTRRLYWFAGAGLRVDGQEIPPRSAIELRADAACALANADQPSELLMLQGRPIGEPVVQQGPFVMTTREELRETFRDYQRTRFGGWSWPSAEPVHPRDEGRFARYADGRVDRPA